MAAQSVRPNTGNGNSRASVDSLVLSQRNGNEGRCNAQRRRRRRAEGARAGAGALSAAQAQGARYRTIVRVDRFITSLCPQ